jgi:hypothetical protein
MAVTIFTMKAESYVDPEAAARDATEMPSLVTRVWPYPIQGGVRALYSQRCVDAVGGTWVPWATYYQDIYGNEYPGSGFDSGTYRVESIIYDREQG